MLRFFAFGQHTGQLALSGRFEHGTPQPRTDVELASLFGAELQRDMDVTIHDLGNNHFSPARLGCVDGMLAEETAIDPVVGIGRDGTDDVAWVDVFDADGHFPVEIIDDGRPQQAPHVGQHGIPGGVAGFVSLEEVLALRPENITVHTLAMKKGSRLMEEGGALPSGEETARMVDLSLEALEGAGYRPYYLYRQKYMSGNFENVGWSKPGAEGLYNIYIMEELHSILSLGAGGSTKMVDPVHQRIERVFHTKYPTEYIQRSEKLEENLSAFRQFHENMRG